MPPPRIKKNTQGILPATKPWRREALTVASGLVLAGGVITGTSYVLLHADIFPTFYERVVAEVSHEPVWPLPLDHNAYNAKMLYLAHYVAPAITVTASSTATTTAGTSTQPVLPRSTATTSVSVTGQLWPKAAAYPYGGAILPFKRIVAYYGNFYSKKMGVLGEYPPEQVVQMLASTTKFWEAADPQTPVLPAIQYIAVVAQGAAGRDGLYRARMPDEEIDKALAMARELHGILVLDVQVAKSTLQSELPALEKYLQMPDVSLGIDPEFSMKYDNAPGTVIGTFDAADINYAASYLASLVDEYKLPPKVLVVHRFTQAMVTNYKQIRPRPEVQVVMDMDGWGSQAKKKGTYNAVIAPEPVQFTGLKLFYKADLKAPSTGLLTPEQVLSLTPAPIYIQYQ